MKLLRLLFVLFLMLFIPTMVIRADCTPPATVGNDTIDCDNNPGPPAGAVEGQDGDDTITIDAGTTVSNYVTGDNLVGAGTGNDTIINNGNVDFIIFGDTRDSGGSGDDYIVNNGTVNMGIEGDGGFATGSGDDTIINNGSTNRIYGDSDNNNGGTGNDTIVNNNTVTDSIYGDTMTNPVASGNDTITNNSTVAFNIYGDDINGAGTGNDTITNNGTVNNIDGANGNNVVDNTGTVNGSITTGADTDTVTNSNTVNGDINVGDGNDTVVIQGNDATVGGTMDGGNGTDVLTFNLTTADPAQAEAWAAEFAAANPNGGTITINGNTYTWTNFEELQYFIELTSRPHPPGVARRPFCAAVGGLDIYVVVGDEGVFSLYASAADISAALSYAQVYEVDVPVKTSDTSQLWALISGEIQVRTAEGEIVSTFFYQHYCGELPEADATLYAAPTPAPLVEEYPAFTIINQPYGG